MQMLAVASGADMIQDLGVYFDQLGKQYLNLHRSLRDENGNRHYTPHDVVVTDHSSLIYEIALSDIIEGVPSWHHQVVGDVSGTQLKVTGVTMTQGVKIIEVIERIDKSFALGVQFHPEEAIRKTMAQEPDSDNFMPLYEAMEKEIYSVYRNAREQAKKVSGNRKVSDEEYVNAARAMASVKAKEGEIENKYFEKYAKILSKKQLFLLKQAEMKFTRQMVAKGKK